MQSTFRSQKLFRKCTLYNALLLAVRRGQLLPRRHEDGARMQDASRLPVSSTVNPQLSLYLPCVCPASRVRALCAQVRGSGINRRDLVVTIIPKDLIDKDLLAMAGKADNRKANPAGRSKKCHWHRIGDLALWRLNTVLYYLSWFQQAERPPNSKCFVAPMGNGHATFQIFPQTVVQVEAVSRVDEAKRLGMLHSTPTCYWGSQHWHYHISKRNQGLDKLHKTEGVACGDNLTNRRNCL